MPRRERHFQDTEERQQDKISKRKKKVNLKRVPKGRPYRPERCCLSKRKKKQI